jgi:three-Cys-motif partner protein
MAAPKETIWKLDPHTKAKHEILRNYLQAWFPILSTWHGRIIYYDGFAGSGRYEGGEIGSPLIAIEVAKDHRAKLASELVFIFIEKETVRAEHLQSELDALTLPKTFKYAVENKDFEMALRETLDYLDDKGLNIAPTFALVDPFGITGLPMELIHRLLERKRCEVLVTFMNHTVERWATELPAQTDRLIGIEGASVDIADAPNRITRARELYEQALRGAARFVRFFEMRNTKNRPIYDLFFATNSDIGHYKMKEAMWRLDATGEFRFSDGVSPEQATLFTPEPARDFTPVLWRHFRGQTVCSDEVLQYTRDETPFLEKHARGALRLLEADNGYNGMAVEIGKKKRDGSVRKSGYPKGTRITFSG